MLFTDEKWRVKCCWIRYHHDMESREPAADYSAAGSFKYLEGQGCLNPGFPLAVRQFFISSTIASELSLPGSG